MKPCSLRWNTGMHLGVMFSTYIWSCVLLAQHRDNASSTQYGRNFSTVVCFHRNTRTQSVPSLFIITIYRSKQCLGMVLWLRLQEMVQQILRPTCHTCRTVSVSCHRTAPTRSVQLHHLITTG